MAATKASPATDEPVKRTATKSHGSPAKTVTKRPAAKAANGSAPAKRATKTAPRATTKAAGAAAEEAPKKTRAAAKSAPAKAPSTRGRGTKGSAPKDAPEDPEATLEAVDTEVEEDLEVEPDLDGEPGEDIEIDAADLNLDDLEDDDVAADAENTDIEPGGAEAALPAAAGEAPAEEDEEIAEPSEKDKASGDFVWDEDESEALRQARKDAELTASADSVRAYLKQIGKVALL
ncbi:MAG: RNA polymerase sigma factor, partial [Mycobacterium sp.]